jgi:hypothetical protein
MVIKIENTLRGSEAINGRAANSTRNRKIKPNLLAPCPFCGGPAQERHGPSNYIVCTVCHAEGPQSTRAGAMDMTEARMKWNTRRSL